MSKYIKTKQPFPERLWTQVNKGGDCWLWEGGVNSKGQPYLLYNGRVVTVHRIAYELTYGAIPEQQKVYRTCANRRCLNPSHLRIGNQDDIAKTRSENGNTRNGGPLLCCKNGHAYTEGNIYNLRINGKMYRRCKTCERTRQRRGYQKKKDLRS
ncbi:HNH endonuclease [Hymenobacter glacieicola]|uniref:HNH endonuclease n=1 Tax=Hymenobacter glacieicola TaxID=1562124 RepID=UPI00166293DC